ncbi:uncharacterized protein LOC111411691 isoform X2 [Olea europaea var. sylvestris]|uniref:uncharacterized protein LOC111411691 isoform X2 n=1 Tax=Olea europaea var. sylvestris TaxID=158386 RepID=UPI000C1D60AE|nr:uncharacterized protein LOC111411691 isoform X2 [Olea europaea var. sylvestris]
MAAMVSSLSANPLSLCLCISSHSPRTRSSPSLASLPSSSSSSHESSSVTQNENLKSAKPSIKSSFVESSKPPDKAYNYALANPNGNPVVRFVQSTESSIERAIFDFRFLALLAVGGSLAGSLLCFLNGCVYIFDAYKVYWSSCVKGIHTGQMVLRLVEAIDVYLAGTVMLIFGMGLYGLFISNVPPDVPPTIDRALKGSSLFGMFALKCCENMTPRDQTPLLSTTLYTIMNQDQLHEYQSQSRRNVYSMFRPHRVHVELHFYL